MKFKNDIEAQSNIILDGALADAGGSPGTVNQLLSSTATGTAWIDPSTIVAEAATLVVIACKNTSGAAIAQGTPVYQTGTVGATATIEIAPADALISANKLPAIGLLQTALNNNGLGFVVITGELTNFTTSPIDGVVPTTGDKVFVKSGGGLTLTKPTGEGNGIQNMGLVGKVSGGNAGSITVSSIMRTNDVPNLPEGRIWIGDGNTIVSDTVYVDEPNNRVGIGTATPGAKLDVNGAGNFSGGTVVSGIDTNTGVGVAIAKGDYLYSNDGNYLRKIIGQQSGGSIDIGQQGTGLISNINFFPGTSGNIDFFGSGSIDMRVASSGNVGIGTTNPAAKLHVDGTAIFDTQTGAQPFYITREGAANQALKIYVDDSAAIFESIQDETADNYGAFQFILDAGVTEPYFDVKKGTGSANILFRVDGNGNVGIGTDSPQEKLQINGGYIKIIDNAYDEYFLSKTRTDGSQLLGFKSHPLGALSIHSAGSEAMRIDSAGNVGIGTDSPDALFDVADRVEIDTYDSSTAASNAFLSGYLRIIAGSKTGWAADDELGKIEFYGEDTSGVGARTAASIVAVCETGNGTSTTTFSSGLAFYTSPYNAAQEERMRINAAGNVGIGTTSPKTKLHVQGVSATEVPIVRIGGFGNSGSKLELAETLTAGGDMNYGFSFFNDGNSSNTLIIKAHNNSTTGVTAFSIDRTNALTTFSVNPVVGTRTAGDNSTRAASTAFVTAAVAAAPQGDITAVTAGTGLTGGGTSGAVTLNAIGGDGITANANDITVDSTVLRTSGNQTSSGVKSFSTYIKTTRIDTNNGQQLVLNAGEAGGQATGQTNELVYLNAESGIEINSSPDNWSSGWAGRKTTYINNSNGDSSFSRNILLGGDLTVSGGDIILNNTGRIQGIDTVSAATDAVNKTYVDNAVAGVPQGDITAVVAGTGLTGGGTSGSVTLNVAASTYTPYDDIRSLGVEAFTNGANPNITTAQVMAEIEGDGGFDSYSSVFKTSWSYAGNYNLTDAGGFTETAGSSWITWTDNSSDTTRGNITTLAIAPNTGGSAGGVFIYNDQGGSYSPGWREVWTSMTDGAGSGLDADKLDGQEGAYYYPASNPSGYTANTGTVAGSGTAGYIPKWGTTSALANSSALYNGTSGLLNINNTFSGSPAGSSSSPDLWITGSTTNSQAVVALMNAKTTSTANQVNGDIEFGTKDDSSAGYVSARIRGIQTSASGSGGAGRGELQFATNVGNTGASPETRMVINYAGNVGIGTTSPLEKLEVQGTIYATPISYASNQNAYVFKMGANNNTAFDQGIKIKSTSGGVSYMSFNSRNEDTLVLRNANVGIGTADPQATLHIDNPQTSSNNIGVILEGAQGGYSTIGMKVNIANYGEGIRFVRTSIYNGNALKFFSNTSQVGSVFVNTSSTSYNTTSDYRSKENVVPMENSINRLKELKPCRFNFIIEPENTVDGFIAHEAQEVVPESVTGEKDKLDYEGNPEYQGIDQSKLVPLLTSALQEAINKIEQLETRMQTLENN